MLFAHFLGIFFRPQVHGTKRVALTLVLIDLPLNYLRSWHCIRRDIQCLKQPLRCNLLRFHNPLRRVSDSFACRIRPRFGSRARFAGL